MNLFISALTLFFFLANSHAKSYTPEKGYVPNKKTALTIAKAVLVPVYGERVLKQKPFKIILKNNRWIIDGTFHCPDGNTCKGGVAHVEIDKKTGKILQMIHGR